MSVFVHGRQPWRWWARSRLVCSIRRVRYALARTAFGVSAYSENLERAHDRARSPGWQMR